MASGRPAASPSIRFGAATEHGHAVVLVAQPVDKRPAVDHDADVITGRRVLNRCRQRLGLELVDQSGEGLFEIGMGRVAGRFRRAGLEDVVEAVARVQPVLGDVVGRGQDRIEDDATDALRVVAHDRLRKVGAIGRPVDVPRVIAEHLAKVGEVGGVLGRIVGAEVGAGGGEFAMTSFRRGQVGALGFLGIEAEAKKLSDEIVGGRTGQRRLREHGTTLAHHVDVPVADEIRHDDPVDIQRDDVARPAGEEDDRIGSFLRRARRIFRDQEPNCATVRLATIFRYDEIAATRLGQLFGSRQRGARRGLETRHRLRFSERRHRRGYEEERKEQGALTRHVWPPRRDFANVRLAQRSPPGTLELSFLQWDGPTRKRSRCSDSHVPHRRVAQSKPPRQRCCMTHPGSAPNVRIGSWLCKNLIRDRRRRTRFPVTAIHSSISRTSFLEWASIRTDF